MSDRKEYLAQYRAQHREKTQCYNKEYYEKNKSRIRQRQKNYYVEKKKECGKAFVLKESLFL